MSLVNTYLTGLRKLLPAEDLDQLNLAHGASVSDLQQLTERYPLCPASLLELLSEIDGTHYRDYPGGEITVLILGSDVFQYPYYLSSAQQMLEETRLETESIAQIYEGYLDEYPDLIDPCIVSTLPMSKRLCFSNCMNNGGTSRLYIDFDPAPGGTVGQVIRFLHDPDSYKVIAQSFDDYLQHLIDDGYAFVYEEET
ncbi:MULTISPECIES: SMI1/KNR4 family protein [Pseudomonas]|uniref:SMI1/KNR4 family protein n=1 Tax=Pseudomonas quercus TaxID=2722792 RepID=A0ABX0YCZ8_9PSED|nr:MULTISPECIES: SMI1/KNR4 family protein [Pseudomonas]MBF7142735.1 SMI1/KNR4 family protein [Pseudomonas sp. LY10J]NJP01273.1 SMI1/KNR4 family protein [Pseudomonas quercus]